MSEQEENKNTFLEMKNNEDSVQSADMVGEKSPRFRPVTALLKTTMLGGLLMIGAHQVSHWVNKINQNIQSNHAENIAQVEPTKQFESDIPHLGTYTVSANNEPEKDAVILAEVGDTHNDIIRKFQKNGMKDFNSAFQAIAFQAEGMHLTPYNAGENKRADNVTIGVGYYIPANLRHLGREKVVEELTQAGISHEDSMKLTSQDPQLINEVEITPRQSMSLLAITMERYKNDAINSMGMNRWNKLGQIAGPEGQAGVAWSVYNGAYWQHKNNTIRAIDSGDRLAVADSIRGTARINGVSQENGNLSLARAAVASRDTFDYAIGYGNRSAANQKVQALLGRANAPTPTPNHLDKDKLERVAATDYEVVKNRNEINFQEVENKQTQVVDENGELVPVQFNGKVKININEFMKSEIEQNPHQSQQLENQNRSSLRM